MEVTTLNIPSNDHFDLLGNRDMMRKCGGAGGGGGPAGYLSVPRRRRRGPRWRAVMSAGEVLELRGRGVGGGGGGGGNGRDL